MLLLFVRHGDPIYTPDMLTPLGHRQAEAIGRRLARYGVDEVFTSDSNRAIQTSIPTCELLKKTGTVLPWANEGIAWDQEKLLTEEGREMWCFMIPEFKKLFVSKSMRELGSRWGEHPFFQEHPSILQGYLRIQKEARNFLLDQGFAYDEERGTYKNLFKNEKRVAFFAHHGFGTNFLSAVLDLPWPQVSTKMDICHSSLTVIYFDPKEEYVVPRMLTLSNDGHLAADNLPTCYNNQIYF